MVILGSGALVQSLRRAGPVDEHTPTTHPWYSRKANGSSPPTDRGDGGI